MQNFIINLLFRLLGNSNTKLYNIQYLYGASTFNHEGRKKRWQNALARMYRDKDLIDYFYYQAEGDKENIFQGKISKDLSRGARIRTFFIVRSAHLAYLEQRKKRKTSAEEKSEMSDEIEEVKGSYKQVANIE